MSNTKPDAAQGDPDAHPAWATVRRYGVNSKWWHA